MRKAFHPILDFPAGTSHPRNRTGLPAGVPLASRRGSLLPLPALLRDGKKAWGRVRLPGWLCNALMLSQPRPQGTSGFAKTPTWCVSPRHTVSSDLGQPEHDRCVPHHQVMMDCHTHSTHGSQPVCTPADLLLMYLDDNFPSSITCWPRTRPSVPSRSRAVFVN